MSQRHILFVASLILCAPVRGLEIPDIESSAQYVEFAWASDVDRLRTLLHRTEGDAKRACLATLRLDARRISSCAAVIGRVLAHPIRSIQLEFASRKERFCANRYHRTISEVRSALASTLDTGPTFELKEEIQKLNALIGELGRVELAMESAVRRLQRTFGRGPRTVPSIAKMQLQLASARASYFPAMRRRELVGIEAEVALLDEFIEEGSLPTDLMGGVMGFEELSSALGSVRTLLRASRGRHAFLNSMRSETIEGVFEALFIASPD